MTTVKFLHEKDGLSIFAYFPELVHNGKYMTCYAHVGQHSACNPEYAAECKEASFNQYYELLRELIGQGYNDLHVINSQTFELHRKPTPGEIKFGEGATHYRSFTLAEIGLSKTGDLKQWFISKDDNLRYYY